MPPRALLLDFGGTLARERRPRATIYADAGRARGLALSDLEMQDAMAAAHAALPRELDGAYRYSDPWFRAFIARIFHGTFSLPEAELAGLAEELFATFSDAASFALFPDATDLVRRARDGGLRIALVSNWGERLAPLVAGLGLELDSILTSALERVEKPDPELFARALARLGVAPSEALHVGDRLDTDVRGAQAAGIAAVWLDRSGRMSDRRGALGARVVRDLTELDPL